MTASSPKPNTHAGRTLAKIHEHPDGISDAEIARILGVRHQIVNMNCRGLVTRGLLIRERQGGTLINRAARADADLTSIPALKLPPQPWFWEGNVQATAVEFLAREGWTILRQANTATREPGNDIETERIGVKLWVTVKGFPVRTPKTQPYTQARHWFAGALFDVILWRQKAPENTQFAVALPIYPTYQKLAERSKWLQREAPFVYFWVSESGEVLNEPGMP